MTARTPNADCSESGPKGTPLPPGRVIAILETYGRLGTYQRNVIYGWQRWSGADLRGKARAWQGKYSRSRDSLLWMARHCGLHAVVRGGTAATGPMKVDFYAEDPWAERPLAREAWGVFVLPDGRIGLPEVRNGFRFARILPKVFCRPPVPDSAVVKFGWNGSEFWDWRRKPLLVGPRDAFVLDDLLTEEICERLLLVAQRAAVARTKAMSLFQECLRDGDLLRSTVWAAKANGDYLWSVLTKERKP